MLKGAVGTDQRCTKNINIQRNQARIQTQIQTNENTSSRFYRKHLTIGRQPDQLTNGQDIVMVMQGRV